MKEEADKAIKEKRRILEGGLEGGETNLRKRKAEEISAEMKEKE